MKPNKSERHGLNKTVAFCIISTVFVITVLAALRFGSVSMSISDFFSAFFGADNTNSVIIYSVRLPRILAAILAGIGLSVSGALLQSVTDNSLASPNVIGVNAGAGFGVILCLAVIPVSSAVVRFSLLPLFAFAFSLLTTVTVVMISSKAGGGRSSIVLAGVAVTALLNAVISSITLSDTDILASYNSFSVGGFSGVEYSSLIIPAIVIACAVVFSMLLSSKIDLLCLGAEGATLLGVRVKVLNATVIIIASASAAAVVSFAGLLGFVGLIVPHVARKIFGHRMLTLIPAAAIIGASVTTLADLVGRLIIAPSEIPVGIMMALVGAPFFILLLFRRSSRDA